MTSPIFPKSIIFSVLFLLMSTSANAQKYATRILFIPLDDRPPCLQFPTQMGLIADAELIAPP